jgi:hypothetical protein
MPASQYLKASSKLNLESLIKSRSIRTKKYIEALGSIPSTAKTIYVFIPKHLEVIRQKCYFRGKYNLL